MVIECHIKYSKSYFQKSTIATFHITKYNSVILRIYNKLGIKQLTMCIAKLRHKDKSAKSRFFALPGEGPALLGMLNCLTY